MNLREQYERDTGKEVMFNPYIVNQHYVAWVERQAACAEQLAAACKSFVSDATWRDDWLRAKKHVQDALAAYEAACKGGAK